MMATELVAGVNDETGGNTMKTMKIFIVLPRPSTRMNPNTISLEVSSSDTVASLKARLEGIDATEYVRPIPPRKQRLVFAGTALPDDDDGRTLADLGVGDSSTLQLVATQMALRVSDPSLGFYYTSILRGLSSTDTVDTLKARYEAATGHIPADRQRFKFHSREMRNGTTLADSGVQGGSTVYVDRLPWHRTDAGHALSRVLFVKVYRWDTVRRVKELVEAALGLPVAAQRAHRPAGYYDHEDLEDARTMVELGVMEWPYESVMNRPSVSIEYRMEDQAGAAEERERVLPCAVTFRGSIEDYSKIVMQDLLGRKEKPYSRPPVPMLPLKLKLSRLLTVFVRPRDPLLP